MKALRRLRECEAGARCPYCQVAAGERCIIPGTTRRAGEPHAIRWWVYNDRDGARA
jgi:hypothetical protein